MRQRGVHADALGAVRWQRAAGDLARGRVLGESELQSGVQQRVLSRVERVGLLLRVVRRGHALAYARLDQQLPDAVRAAGPEPVVQPGLRGKLLGALG